MCCSEICLDKIILRHVVRVHAVHLRLRTSCLRFQPEPPSSSCPVLFSMTGFGRFDSFCRSTSSYPWCNLFYRQVCRVRLEFFCVAFEIHFTAPTSRPKRAHRSIERSKHCSCGHQSKMRHSTHGTWISWQHCEHHCVCPQLLARRWVAVSV